MIIGYIFIFLLGITIGSFLNVCIYRLPANESIIFPPSHCGNCKARLKAIDLVPVLSFLFLKGKCRYCNNSISSRYAIVELITGFVYLIIYHQYHNKLFECIIFISFMTMMIVMFFIDYDTKTIPDELVITGLIIGGIVFVYNIFYEFSFFREKFWYNPLIGMLVGSGFLLLVAVLGAFIFKTDEAMGFGDVKIFAPIGLILGWKMTIMALFLSIISSGFISLFLVLFKIRDRKDTIPLGPFIVLGTFLTILYGWDILIWYLPK